MADLKRSFFGYSRASVRSALAEHEATLTRASDDARSAERRAERLASELSELERHAQRLQEELDGALERQSTLAAELGQAQAETQAAAETLRERDEQLASAHLERARLAEELRLQGERVEQATAEAVRSQQWLQRALEDSAGYKASLGAREERVAELEALVAAYQEETASRDAAVHAVGGDRAEDAGTGPSTAEELDAVLQVTEQAVLSIIGSTKARADRELRAIDTERDRIRRDVETMTAWRDRAVPTIASVRAAAEDVKRHAAGVAARVNEALHPVQTAVTQLTSQIASLESLSREAPPRPVDPTDRPGARVIELRDEVARRDTPSDR